MDALEDAEETGIVCTNPLTWELGGGLAGKEHHLGAVPAAGEYHLELSGDDSARGVRFDDMGEPLPQHVEALCKGGRLYITDQSDNAFGERGGFGGNYHGLDYAIFYMDIRENARQRAAAYLTQGGAAAGWHSQLSVPARLSGR
jgi:hypothetical protein